MTDKIRFHYKRQTVNAIYGNDRYLLRENHTKQVSTLSHKTQSF